jgi:CubicO group peptidase (beta-lactamase class C family)
MRKIAFVLTLFLVFLAGAPALAQGELADEMIRETEALAGPDGAKGAILAVVKDGEVTFAGGFGWADEAMNISAAENIAFRIGSISKTFVAVAAQLLAEQGMIDMDRDIADYLEPDFPAFERPVTMRQLLTHSAGFEDLVTGIAVPNVSDTLPLSVSVRRYKPVQSIGPGVISYSNYGIALAAYVVERVADEDFAAFCRAEIFLPLKMTHTTFEHMHDVAYVAKPYLPDGRETLEPYMNLYPEGSAVSTAADMAAYMLWLTDPDDARVLSSVSKAELFARQYSMADDLLGMGYTWNRKVQNGQTYFDKKGETLHFYSRIALYPEKNAAVFLSVNTYLPEDRIDGVMKAATDALCGRAEYAKGRATFDIAGFYANNWSSFETPEKILRYVVPGKLLRVEGSIKEGYSIGGQALTLVGEDAYASSMGVMKFMKWNGHILIATESAITYAKIPFWQASGVQVSILVVCAALILVTLALALFAPLRGRRKRDAILIAFLALEAALLCALCAIIFHVITSFRLLDFAVPMRVLGWGIVAVAILGAWRARKVPGLLRVIVALWTLSNLALTAQMSWMRILMKF